MRARRGLLLLVPLAPACAESEAAGELAPGRFEFVDVAPAAGIDVVGVSGDPRRWYIPESNGTGAAWIDHDSDGDLDLFVGNGADVRYVDGGRRLEILRTATSHLYRNDGELAFTDVSEAAGAARDDWINAIATADVEGDGDADLYLGCFGRDALLRNEGGRFVDGGAEAGLENGLWGAGAAFGDPDLDGDLDLYVANYCLFDPEAPPLGGRRNVVDGVEIGWGPEGENGRGLNLGAPDVYYANEGGGRFAERTEAAGLALERALCSYAAVFTDVDRDGWPDLCVANDLQPANLFHNEGDGTFDEEGVERGFAFDGAGEVTSAMGLLVADVDRDGDFDCLRTNFDLEPNTFHENDGSGRFRDRTARLGLGDPGMDRLGWGGGFFDADLDGDLDCVVANGHVLPQAEEIGMSPWAQRSQLYEAYAGADGALRYRDATERAGEGFAPLRSARGVAIGDPDDDGDLDLAIVDLDAPPRLLENRTPRRGRWLAVRLVGTGANTAGIGAVVTVRAGGGRWTREVTTGGGLYSAHDPRAHFGLGPVERVDEVAVDWPGGARQVVREVPLDAVLTVRQHSEPRQGSR